MHKAMSETHTALCPHCRCMVTVNSKGKRLYHDYHHEAGKVLCWGSEVKR